VAFEDEVVDGSMIFGGGDDDDDNDDDDDAAKPAAAGGAGAKGDATAGAESDGEGEEAWEAGMNTSASGGSRSPTPVPPSSKQRSPPSATPSKTKQASGGRRDDALEEAREAIRTGSAKISRTMYRLKNFKSHKLVERQGQALGAHARGEHKEAIAKLAEVAEAAPLAPQVYSTLGLVYENMLREKDAEDVDMGGSDDEGDDEEPKTASTEAGSANGNAAAIATGGEGAGGGQKNKAIHSKLVLAKKAYGSFHIAAVMCKKDFTLWVRAGDAALDISDMYSDLIGAGSCPGTDAIDYTAEREKWTTEAKNDFQAADNLQPPGISIPSKLAAVQMELGNLSEALTILTDCKNQSQSAARTSGGARSDMEKSYGVWLLYADLMLRIGFGCKQWNRGIQSNSNYMFKRWLRKYSTTFDWKELRLQALCMALEAAAGSAACSELGDWLRLRAAKLRLDLDGQNGDRGSSGGFDSGRWKVGDAYESDQQKEQTGAAVATTKAGAVGREAAVGTANDDDEGGDENNSEANGMSVAADSTPSEIAAAKMADNEEAATTESSPDERSFEEKREALISSNKAELLAFDEETKALNLSPNSKEGREREILLSDLVKRHRSSLVAFVGEHYQREQAKKDSVQAAQSTDGRVGDDSGTSREPLPMSASCATVCNIATLLMKQCIDLQLFQGPSLVGEAVSSYLKERVERLERKPTVPDSNPLLLSQNPFDTHLSYDHVDEDGASDSEDSMIDYLSDDEDLDSPSKAGAIEGMRNGVLPDELQVLVGVSLLVEGGKNYAAQRALSAIARLQDDAAMATQLETGSSSDWSSFCNPFGGVTSKTSFFALTAGLVYRMEDDKAKNCLNLIPLFQEYAEKIEKEGLLEGVETNASVARISDNSDSHGQGKAKYREIFLSLLKLLMIRAREESLNVLSNEKIEDGCKNSMTLLDFVIRYEEVLWDGQVQGLSFSILQSDSEILRILSEVFSTLVKAKQAYVDLMFSSTPSSGGVLELMDPVLAKLRHILSVLLCISLDMPTPKEAFTASFATTTSSTLPLPSNWQSGAQENLSRRAFNLCVGYAVPASNLAWRPDGLFSLEVMMNTARDSNVFGISLSYDETMRAWVCGILPEKVEMELASQLQTLQEGGLVNIAIWDEFSIGFQTIKETDWYSRTTEKLQRQGGREVLSQGGEQAGMALLLLLSRSYLTIAKMLDPEDTLKKESMVKTVLSIVLPIAQFCTGKRMWNSRIGTCTVTESERREWNRFVDTRLTFEGLPVTAEKPAVNESRRRRKPSQPPRIKVAKPSAPPPPAREEVIQNAIRLSSSALLNEWLKESVVAEGNIEEEAKESAAAKEAMAQLDEALKVLHKSTTLPSMQKSSLVVASALLKVANQSNCYNPFQCLQHAVMFASNGPKLGKNDVLFKKVLSQNDLDCPPIEALMILGRADCLRALHFTDEAIFLCSHVLTLCSKQREIIPPAAGVALTPTLPSKWSAVNAYAYMVSIATDYTLSSLLHACNREVTTLNWSKEALEEIAHGRAAAMRIGGINDLPLIGSTQPRATNVHPPAAAAGRHQDEFEEYGDWDEGGSDAIGEVEASSAVLAGLQELKNDDYYEVGDEEHGEQVEMVAV